MPVNLDTVAANLKRELSAPDWIKFEVDYRTDSICIGDRYVDFVLRRNAVDDNLHVRYARAAVDCLIKIREGDQCL
jgi:hypothetical protein